MPNSCFTLNCPNPAQDEYHWGWPGMPAEVLERRRGAPTINAEGKEAESSPETGIAPGINSQTAMVGKRGPAGGIYATCEGCGRVWEREKRRGRPSARCGECK